MPSTTAISCSDTLLDVELPEHSAPSAVDVDLTMIEAAQMAEPSPGAVFQPTLSQAAAEASRSHVRWPGATRSGYHGASDWNWMRDSTVGAR